jgi:hypothetical protein
VEPYLTQGGMWPFSVEARARLNVGCGARTLRSAEEVRETDETENDGHEGNGYHSRGKYARHEAACCCKGVESDEGNPSHDFAIDQRGYPLKGADVGNLLAAC